MKESLGRTKLEKCLQKMIQNKNLPIGSKLLFGERQEQGKIVEGCDYIKTPSGEIIFFEHKFDNEVLDNILEGNYRISKATYNPKRWVVEVKIGKEWKKLEPELAKIEPLEIVKYKYLKFYPFIFLLLGLIILFISFVLSEPELSSLSIGVFMLVGLYFALSRMPPKRAERVVTEFFDVYIITKYRFIVGVILCFVYIIIILLMMNEILNPNVGWVIILFSIIFSYAFILIYYGFLKKEFK